MMFARVAGAAQGETGTDFAYVVPFELGEAEFAAGDSITIQQVRGTSETIRVGGTYCVEGIYTLGSSDKAELALYATTHNPAPSAVEPSQRMQIEKGSGSFRLIKTMTEEGYLHLSFYPRPSGSAFGGVYFGQGQGVLRHKGFSYQDRSTASPDYTSSGTTAATPPNASGPNQALYEYLGSPVPPPPGLDAAYSKAGLINAVQTAARNAGLSLKQVEIDDSEFPFLVGVICAEGNGSKLIEQIKQMAGYEYNGSVGSHASQAINIVPRRLYPVETSQRINRRNMLRLQVFFDRLNGK